ncbi:MAG: hypothetical protein ACKOPI_00620 [bacterium]
MSSKMKASLLVGGALTVVVALFFVLEGGSGSESGSVGGDAVTTTSSGPREEAKAAQSYIQMKGGEPVGGPQTIRVTSGERVEFTVVPDGSVEEIHVHGYDIAKQAEGSRPLKFSFPADLEGSYEIEAHTVSGAHSLVATLEVRPT